MSRAAQLMIRQIPKRNFAAGQQVLRSFPGRCDAKPHVAYLGNFIALNSSFSTFSRLNAADHDASKIDNSQATGKTKNAVHTRIDELVHANKVVVFMKGVPNAPQCGFSNAVVQVLRMHGVSDFDAHNVLDDSDLRQGVKDYSSWPTIPQIYINGEFVGGSDILLQLHQSGELIDEFEKAGISSSLVAKEIKNQERKKPANTD